MVRALALLLAALCLAAPAAAQDGSEASEKRTIESAQQFLADFYTTLGAQIEVFQMIYNVNGEWRASPKPEAYSALEYIEAKLVSVSPAEHCKTNVKVRDSRRLSIYITESREAPVGVPKFIIATIDWSKVTGLSVQKRTIYKSRSNLTEMDFGWQVAVNGTPGLSLVHGTSDEEGARRAAFAMNYLREQCAPKNDTGF